MAKELWKPGTAPYATWLAALTPEEKAKHLLERKQKKTMKVAMQEVIDAQREVWLASLNNALASVLQRAVETGDPSALIAVYDRLVGKPDTNVDVTSNGSTIQAPTIIFATQELTEWEDVKQ